MEQLFTKYRSYLIAAGVLVLVLLTCNLCKAQTPGDWPDSLDSWTEGGAILFDQFDGEFGPELTGRFAIWEGDKSFGWFFGENDQTGPSVAWRAWKLRTGDVRWSIFMIGSSDLSDAKDAGMWNDALLGTEIGFYWDKMKNLEIRAGLLNARFVEGEPTRITPYVGLAFRL